MACCSVWPCLQADETTCLGTEEVAQRMTQGAMLEIGADAVSSSIKPNFQGRRAFLLMLWCSENDSACSHHTAFKDCPHTESPVFQLEWFCHCLFLTLVVFWCRCLVRTDVQCFSGMAEQLPKRKKKSPLQLITGHPVKFIKLWGSNWSHLHLWKMGKAKVEEIACCFAFSTTVTITLLLDEIPLQEKPSS